MVMLSSLFGQILSEIFSAVNFENLVADFGCENPRQPHFEGAFPQAGLHRGDRQGVCRFRSVSFLEGTGNLLRHENEGQCRLCSGRSPYAAEGKDDRLRQDRTPDGNACAEAPRAASEDRREEPGEEQRGDRSSDQSSPVRSEHDKRDLQRSDSSSRR